jgi:Conjugal transfer protein TraD
MRDRRERTRHLIELGGLVQKAGLVELVNDDRATLLGAFLDIAQRLQEAEPSEEGIAADLCARWRRRGLRAFDADHQAAGAEVIGPTQEVPKRTEVGNESAGLPARSAASFLSGSR